MTTTLTLLEEPTFSMALSDGEIRESYRLDGADIVFGLQGEVRSFDEFTIELIRDADEALTGLQLVLPVMPIAEARFFVERMSSSIDIGDLSAFAAADLTLRLRPEVLAQEVVPRIDAMENLVPLLELADGEGYAVTTDLSFYTIAGFTGYDDTATG